MDNKKLQQKMDIESIERAFMERLAAPFATAGMEMTKEGFIKPNSTNLMMAVRQLPLSFDTFTGMAFIKDDGKLERFQDKHFVQIACTLEKGGFSHIPSNRVRDIVKAAYLENSYDAALEWANSLVWDGVPRAESLFSKYFGVAESPYEAAVSMYFATAMAGRLLQGGVQADMVPVLIGGQGVGKTRSVMALAPLESSYAEIDMGNTKDSDMSRMMRGKLICELGELKGLRSRDSEWIKSWISRSSEEWVEKYEVYSTIMPRRCVFIGTSNETQFLVDGTGNRRWLPLSVTNPCDPEAITRDREQIWAEAIHYFKLIGVAWKAAQELAQDVHKEHMVIDDVMIERVDKFLNSPVNTTKQGFTIDEVCSFLGLGANVPKKDQHRIGDALRHLGYEKVRKRFGSKVQKTVWQLKSSD
jgi:predicted P-loop ATPase